MKAKNTVKVKSGHRMLKTTNEPWPEWSRFICGIAGGFMHFEDEGDYNKYLEFMREDYRKTKENAKVTESSEAVSGRCVNECGKIGFAA